MFIKTSPHLRRRLALNPARRVATLAAVVAGLLLVTGCGQSPTRIDPGGDQKVTSMQVDYNEIVEWSQTLTHRMLASGVLDDPAYQPHPVRMVVSDIQNKTDMSDFPYEMVLGRIRSALLQSGKVRYVSTYGQDATDRMAAQSQDITHDPRYKHPDWIKDKKFSVARLSLRTQILYRAARSGRKAQNTYEVRMFVTDNATGETVWEGFSNPIAKRSEKAVLGF